jgi:hypothetical protein
LKVDAMRLRLTLTAALSALLAKLNTMMVSTAAPSMGDGHLDP